MVKNAVIAEIDEILLDNKRSHTFQVEFVRRRRIHCATWVWIEKNPNSTYIGDVSHTPTCVTDTKYMCSVSAGGGEPWAYYANFAIFDDRIELSTKSIGFRRQYDIVFFTFAFCDPGFPDNFIRFLKLAATDINAFFAISHCRSVSKRKRLARNTKDPYFLFNADHSSVTKYY